jgi:PKD repeat protein
MKRIIYLSLVFTAFLFSCEKNPDAQFSTNTVEPVVGQEVYFYNNSHNADRFEWDFGDGYISNENSPVHIFNSTGAFEVILTSISKNGLEAKASITLNVVIPTFLEIEVREYYEEYVVPDASVILYPTATDWDAQKNMISEGFTDANGVVIFANLDPFVYYVDVWEATHDNYTLRDEDVGFIRTPEVLPHQINRFIAWVDYVDHGKGIGRGSRSMVIKKFERVSTDKKQPSPVTDNVNWQEYYSRSVKRK